MTTALYTITRVYQVPAGNRLEATDRMLEALTLGVEDDFHVKDVLREPDGKPGSGVRISLTPPKGWRTLLLDQLLGRSEKTKR
jgi:hypothetical protein